MIGCFPRIILCLCVRQLQVMLPGIFFSYTFLSVVVNYLVIYDSSVSSMKNELFLTSSIYPTLPIQKVNSLSQCDITFKLQSSWMIKSAAIRVAVKVRPITTAKSIVRVGQGLIEVELPDEQVQSARVQSVHDAARTKDSAYHNCGIGQLVTKFTEGCHAAVLAYGQTGSGKTHALQGTKDEPGIITQAIEKIYQNVCPNAEIRCSSIQLYNERISDMLSPDKGAQKGLRIRWQAEKQFVIEDLTQVVCSTAEEMKKQWMLGRQNRVVASNKVHDHSSRSHAIFVVILEDRDKEGNFVSRQMFFVDLAGSERVLGPVGRLTKEAIQINKSLFHLRKVILSLEEVSINQKNQHIAYRDSKLTSILKKAFGGNCLTCMIACLNPSEDYLEETLSTLQYAMSAARIKNQVNINFEPKTKELMGVTEQRDRLKKELQIARLQIENFESLEREEQAQRLSHHEYSDRIIECIGTVRQLLKSNKELRAQLQRQKKQRAQLSVELESLQKQLKIAQVPPALKAPTALLKESPFTPKGVNAPETVNTPVAIRTNQSSTSRQFLKQSPQPRRNSVVRRKRYTFHSSDSRSPD